ADGKDFAAEHGVAEEDVEPDADGEGDEEEARYGADGALAELADRRGQGVVGYGAGEDQHGAGKETGTSEGDHEAVDAGLDDGDAVKPGHGGTHQQRGDDGNGNG